MPHGTHLPDTTPVTSALPALFVLASLLWELVVFGLLMVGAFVIVVLANFVAEYRFTHSDVRRRVLVGEGSPLAPF